MARWAVCGGGMRGIVAAAILAGRGEEVTLIEREPELGGLLCSEEWDGLFIDRGCHLLDFGHARSGRLYEAIMGADMHPVRRSYASINGTARSGDIAVPDMSGFPEPRRREAIASMREVAGSDLPAVDVDLRAALRSRFGAIAGDYAADCARKMTGLEPAELDARALGSMPLLHRIRMGSDAEMIALKKDPLLDQRLAASPAALGLDSAAGEKPRNQYPSRKGMRGFCEAARLYLHSRGVRLLLGASIESVTRSGDGVRIRLAGEDAHFDRIYWSGPSAAFFRFGGMEDPAAGTAQPVGLVTYAFRVAPDSVSDLTYAHDFRADTLSFRTSAPGVYGRQRAADGTTYVMAEIAAPRADPIWREPASRADQAWADMKSTGIVGPDATYSDVRAGLFPVAYMLPKRGASAKLDRRAELLATLAPQILFASEQAFGKAAIYDAVEADMAGA